MKYKVKSLIVAAQELEVNVIAQQCNCFCAMGAGVAPLIADAFPDARIADNETVTGDFNKLGTISVGQERVGDEYVTVFNLYGQYSMGGDKQNTDYDALRSAFKLMAVQCIPFVDRIGLPKLGCGLAGGDWNVVSEIIKDELDEFDVTIYVLDESEIPSE